MQKHIADETTGISYTLVDDYYIPDLHLPEPAYEIGRFGRLHQKFMKEHRRLVYTELLTSGKLNKHLHNVDLQAQEMFELLVKEMAAKQGMTERLKAENQMEWVGIMNNIRNAVEEIVLTDIVYR